MNSKERVIRAIEFDGPDRIPHMHSYRYATLEKYGKNFTQMLGQFPSDFFPNWSTKDSLDGSDKGTFIDEWGVTWVKIQDGYSGQPKGHPLANWEEFDGYEIPDPEAGSSPASSKRYVTGESLASEERYVCMYGGTLFQRLQWLRGMRNVFIDLATKRRELYQLADAIVEYDIAVARMWCERGADAIVFADDWGTQDGLMIRPSLWREAFKPRYREIFRAVRTMGAKVHFHSDGYIMDIIPDLIELGVDVINPQINVHDIDELGEVCGGRICIRGGLDRQNVLPYGSRADVRGHVLDVIGHFAVFDGGWIACGELGPDVPFANCEEMMHSFFRFGRYCLWILS